MSEDCLSARPAESSAKAERTLGEEEEEGEGEGEGRRRWCGGAGDGGRAGLGPDLRDAQDK